MATDTPISEGACVLVAGAGVWKGEPGGLGRILVSIMDTGPENDVHAPYQAGNNMPLSHSHLECVADVKSLNYNEMDNVDPRMIKKEPSSPRHNSEANCALNSCWPSSAQGRTLISESAFACGLPDHAEFFSPVDTRWQVFSDMTRSRVTLA
ncbi:hypothetical protein ARMGADRAFT_1105658 [Armillaria gallica]|uniref:Uncharacterized protein n=1 Tax=Armillaria gallica TaxID=47427 RepID=A0A2H3DSH5_ARMGA|nr:hypothetical protein ARMGADRAFT_1105658 [Armillaria gallica]